MLTGLELDRLEEAAFADAVRTTSVYARIAPQHKIRTPFFTKRPGITNTEVLSSGTAISHSHRSMQTSSSRLPVLTLNSAIWRFGSSGSSAKRKSCSSHDSG